LNYRKDADGPRGPFGDISETGSRSALENPMEKPRFKRLERKHHTKLPRVNP